MFGRERWFGANSTFAISLRENEKGNEKDVEPSKDRFGGRDSDADRV